MTKNCEMTLVIMFFCESLKFLQLRLRCIMSWSSPVMAIMVKAPARNCLKKYCLLFTSSKKKMRDMSLSAMVLTIPVNDRLRSEAIYQMQSTTDTTKQNVFRESVQIRDFTPPWKVYNQTSATVMATFSRKGSPKGSNTSSCNVRHTRNRRTAAPSILEMKKNQAPVR